MGFHNTLRPVRLLFLQSNDCSPLPGWVSSSDGYISAIALNCRSIWVQFLVVPPSPFEYSDMEWYVCEIRRYRGTRGIISTISKLFLCSTGYFVCTVEQRAREIGRSRNGSTTKKGVCFFWFSVTVLFSSREANFLDRWFFSDSHVVLNFASGILVCLDLWVVTNDEEEPLGFDFIYMGC